MTEAQEIAFPRGDDRENRSASEIVADLLVQRRSCRGYLPDPAPHHLIEQMLEMAQLSASWCNSQPWQVIVTEGLGTERVRERYYDYVRQMVDENGVHRGMQPDFEFPTYRGIYKERQREVGWQLYQSVGIEFGDRAASLKQSLENFRFFGAPHMLIVTSERDLGAYGAIDCGLYMGTLLIAAQSLGIGIVPQAAMASYAPFLRDYFSLADNRVVIMGASFGYADHTHPANSFRARRAALSSAVTWVTE